MNLLNRDFRQMKIAGQHTPFWGGQDGRFLHVTKGYTLMKSSTDEVVYSNGIYIFIFGYKRLTSEGYPILVFLK